MRRWLFLAPIFVSTFLAAQVATIEPDNPSPRSGEQVMLSVTLRKGNQGPHETAVGGSGDTLVASGTLKFVQIIRDTGRVKIGPFSFSVGEETYIAPAVFLNVRPSLPAHVSEGIWITVKKFHQYHYVIVEQRVPNTVKRDEKDPNTIKLDINDVVFAELNTEKIEQSGMEFVSMSVNTSHQHLSGRSGSRNVAYKISSYKFKATPRFKGNLKIDRSYFHDFPKGVKLEDTYIN